MSGFYGAGFYETLVYTPHGFVFSSDEIYQYIPTQAGTTYILSFWLNEVVGGNYCSVGWNGNSVRYNIGNSGWTNIQLAVTATGTNTLLSFTFQISGTPNGIYALNYIDNISVTPQLPANYDLVGGKIISGGNMQLSFVGNASANYALDRSFTLAPPNWVPQMTNSTDVNGQLFFTNTPNTSTNNFWRIRSVP